MVKSILRFALIYLFLLKIALAANFTSPLAEEDLKILFLSEITRKLGLMEHEVRLEKFRFEPKEVELRKGQDFKVDWLAHPRAGSNTLLLTYRGKDAQTKTLRLWGYVEVLRPVPVLAKAIQAGEIIKEEHLSYEERGLSRLPHDVVLDQGLILGREVRMSLKAGTVLRSSHLQLPLLIKRNEEVEILAQGGGLVVKAKGIALENGRLGEVIRVRNKESNKVIFAKVSKERIVEVSF